MTILLSFQKHMKDETIIEGIIEEMIITEIDNLFLSLRKK